MEPRYVSICFGTFASGLYGGNFYCWVDASMIIRLITTTASGVRNTLCFSQRTLLQMKMDIYTSSVQVIFMQLFLDVAPHQDITASDSHPPSMTIATNVKNGL
ncbi:hypothetical protein BLNAU_3175 [Blattamonas nauphoetae]|uniref:Uncharacterized protein n=1 Tax=Blattamonas nauphoetae TaxID=2049346 RepID=A0ABQ9XQR0_9EUKA|nr:hypothetical protein BLNAU_24525 [Blattamonas nauphoetae]KAK2946243.1 hypothetical protein BLNAU_18845 [Blattamonas nauphoetae]KAK2946679.1 hypothetical protein BLNAU_18431 [Blattamonas nauphoetae]KAK2951803.1 hypothetical protein BLNAU_13296 [Blattamonas nauphoetae]KAK2953909.1 hypothetical protein BLNAU_11169 [Blattamonas nauphoetae]